MEHEVFVPYPVDTVRQALAEPARVARCVPGLQQDAGETAEPLAGRLRLRIGGSTITYRGVLRLTERGEGFAVEGEGDEARGGGSVRLALTVRPRAVAGGTTLTCSGTVQRGGRLAEFEAKTLEAAARRLWDRFGAALASGLEAEPIAGAAGDAGTGTGVAGEAGAGATADDALAGAGAAAAGPGGVGAADGGTEDTGAAGGSGGDVTGAAGAAESADGARSEGPDEVEWDGAADVVAGSDGPTETDGSTETDGPAGIADMAEATEITEISEITEVNGFGEAGAADEADDMDDTDDTDDLREADGAGEAGEADGAEEIVDIREIQGIEALHDEVGGAGGADDPQDDAQEHLQDDLQDDLRDMDAAEAAHARRTMIGRSTEEVDHAPPRGRYAPVPAPQTTPGGLPLRWAAPAAALVIASAVVVGRRILRRRA